MTMNNQLPRDELEQWVTRQVQSLPLRKAPQTLSMQVMAELQRRAALPWWRKSFLYLPFSARMAFMALCLGLANGSVALLRWLSAKPHGLELSAVLNRPITWTERLIEAAQSVQNFLELVVSHLPALWVYGGLLAIVLLYVALFGIGATAYRTLYAGR
jgi:hypothetical protein